MNALTRQNTSGDDRENMVCIGAVFGAAGVRGAVRVKVFTERAKSIGKYGPVKLYGHEFPDGKIFDVKILHNVKGGVAVKFDGIDDRDMADAIKGSELYIERAKLPEIKETDDFYFEDLIGLKVKDQNGSFFGSVDGVFNFGAGDIVEVSLSKEKGKKMYPFSEEIVPEVNIEDGYITVLRDAFGDEADVTETDQKG